MRDAHIDLSEGASLALEQLRSFDPEHSDRSRASIEADKKRLVQEAIVDGIGLETFRRRVELDIAKLHLVDDLCLDDYRSWHNLIGMLIQPVVSPSLFLRPLFKLHTTLADIPDRTLEAVQVWFNTHDIFRFVICNQLETDGSR